MLKIEQVYREILYQAIEKKNRTLTQKALSTKLKISISTVNHALKALKKIAAIKINPRNFKVINPKKILLYWACIRKFEQDIIYKTRVNKQIRQIEQAMPPGIVYTAYSGYKFCFKDSPADYSEVYVYAKTESLKDIKARFPSSKKPANLFVLKADKNMTKYNKTATIANCFVDLWNLKEWYAKDFLKALEARIDEILG